MLVTVCDKHGNEIISLEVAEAEGSFIMDILYVMKTKIWGTRHSMKRVAREEEEDNRSSLATIEGVDPKKVKDAITELIQQEEDDLFPKQELDEELSS